MRAAMKEQAKKVDSISGRQNELLKRGATKQPVTQTPQSEATSVPKSNPNSVTAGQHPTGPVKNCSQPDRKKKTKAVPVGTDLVLSRTIEDIMPRVDLSLKSISLEAAPSTTSSSVTPTSAPLTGRDSTGLARPMSAPCQELGCQTSLLPSEPVLYVMTSSG